MAITPKERQIRKIIKQVNEDMENVGTYRPQFDRTVRTYAEMSYDYKILMRQFEESNDQFIEEYTNKSGATNAMTTAIYSEIKMIRKEMVSYESILGLTPAGLKKINKEMDQKKKTSNLAKALSKLGT
ncbi:P27 family phage terminase small subunit [Neobacillus sp. MM2021_6]|uniref:P27 family phage terminase small subunit n=1 Tax=Bacillaceae TaxID=186817 RepID=UPI00140921D7|nr:MULTISPECIES: P27 family phage terminase small subunit [Bacillaceae]MBO0962504.1 P27 family phage terminase small subunit [Neobacillus sp. MM2021_6]NHC21293.1 P27 family phage terminase small subunit [Bacillus sp. MM2020_4]